MNRHTFALLIAFSTAFVLASCNSGPEPLYDLSNENYSLLDTDSSHVQFPDDYGGEIAVISFIFTHCPDVCPAITANMNNIQRNLDDTTGIQFIEISFDPERDTPSVLTDYKNRYRLNDQFTFLTGQPANVDSLLERLDIVAVKTYPDSTVQDSGNYSIRHSNYIYLMDTEGRIRAEYPASRVPPEHVTVDIQTLRNE